MDDDAPLSALAKAPKFDDDTPLASLADVGKPRAGPKAGAKAGSSPAGKVQPKGSPKAAAPAKGKGKGKGTPTKRKAGGSSSSSSSSDSDDSSSSGSDQKAQGRKKGPVGKGKKMKLLQKMQTDDGMENDGGGAVKKRDRTVKEQVVADLLCRWWYVLPEWPPRDEAYYKAELAKRSLRKVTIEEWEWVPEEDAKGHKKVYELSQFRGLFRSSNGDLVDVRPKETCPCYANLMKKDLADLYDLLVKAFENQMKDLQNSKYNETQLEQELKVRMTSVRERAYQAKQLAGAKKGN